MYENPTRPIYKEEYHAVASIKRAHDINAPPHTVRRSELCALMGGNGTPVEWKRTSSASAHSTKHGTLHCSQRPVVWHQQNQIQSKCSPSFCKCICKSLFDSVILPCRNSAWVGSFSYGTPNRPEYTGSTRLILKSSFFFSFFWNTSPFIPWSLLKKRWSTSEVLLEGIQGNSEETINDSSPLPECCNAVFNPNWLAVCTASR